MEHVNCIVAVFTSFLVVASTFIAWCSMTPKPAIVAAENPAGRESLDLSWIDFSGEQINDGEADQKLWNAYREEGVERRLFDSNECFNHGRLLGLI